MFTKGNERNESLSRRLRWSARPVAERARAGTSADVKAVTKPSAAILAERRKTIPYKHFTYAPIPGQEGLLAWAPPVRGLPNRAEPNAFVETACRGQERATSQSNAA